MNVSFRVDASQVIGAGHVMRCITLAESLRASGASCQFILGKQDGNLAEVIEAQGFHVAHLKAGVFCKLPESDKLPNPLTSQLADLEDPVETAQILSNSEQDWLVVDHYFLSKKWERRLRSSVSNIMVIDDYVSRAHDCDLLLNQNLDVVESEFDGMVPANCRILAGTDFALLRKEFVQYREYSLNRRKGSAPRSVLLSMGGMDWGDSTSMILSAMRSIDEIENFDVTVVLGQNAPWARKLRDLVAELPFNASLNVGATNMALLMANADIAIGAAGSTSWERACLGLPTLMIAVADNQQGIATALEKYGAVRILTQFGTTAFDQQLAQFFRDWTRDTDALLCASNAASDIVDGRGVDRVVAAMEEVSAQ